MRVVPADHAWTLKAALATIDGHWMSDSISEKALWLLDTSADFILNEYKARQSWDRRDYLSAISQADKAAQLALVLDDDAGFWRMTLLKAECQMELGSTGDFAATAALLSEHPVTKAHPLLQKRAKALQSHASLGQGQMTEALRMAREAAASAIPDDGASGRTKIQFALIAALAESGDLVDAWGECLVLADMVVSETDLRTAGKAYWAIGNVAFLMEKREEGAIYHDQAAEFLSPSNDVNLWALFNKASAYVRLAAGLIEPATLECIERAELAISVTGGTKTDEMEIALVRVHWSIMTGEEESALIRLQELRDQEIVLPPEISAEMDYLLGLALYRLERHEEALIAANRANAIYLDSGAGRRAVESAELVKMIEALNR